MSKRQERRSAMKLPIWGKKRIGDLRDDQTEDAASSGNQGPRLSVGVVTELLHRLPDPFRELRIYGGNAVDDTRNGRSGNLGAPRDLTDAHRNAGVIPAVTCVLAKTCGI